VRPGITISCGCVGRKQFIDYHEQRAANISSVVQNSIFKLARHPNKKKRLGVYFLAKKFKLSGYIVDFVIAAKCAALRALKGAGDAALRGLNWVSRRWLRRSEEWDNYDLSGRKMKADRKAFLSALPHWRDRDAYLAAEAAAEATLRLCSTPMTDEMWTSLLDGSAEVEFVETFTPVEYTVVRA
jgi:hypothetical protein